MPVAGIEHNQRQAGRCACPGRTRAVGLVVEFSPATREARVRFPDCAKFLSCFVGVIQGRFADLETAKLRRTISAKKWEPVRQLPQALRKTQKTRRAQLAKPPSGRRMTKEMRLERHTARFSHINHFQSIKALQTTYGGPINLINLLGLVGGPPDLFGSSKMATIPSGLGATKAPKWLFAPMPLYAKPGHVFFELGGQK